ncbi:MAG: M28 family peptidase [Caldilineaceae bacterium SB0675_bin_29]|uniref:M28 family peptidase n=1 Tax=Caldilineaceae bacterium SB0675_bin_29 TaxID=2605266 RepID=A0A6B1FX97_9CHLR|nr:M28 family peptidase [Caldilineaceae bacterium SB0675_bin_29]
MSRSKSKRFPLAVFPLLVAILLSSCYFHLDEEIADFFDHGPVYEHRYVATAPLCTKSEKRWQETLDGAPPPPAAAKFNAAERQALAITAFGYLCELTTRVGWRQSASKEEVKAAEFLIDRFTKFGYSPETQDFHVRIGPLWRKSSNIIVELPGQGENVVIISAHYDTVRDSVGANDNASGVGVMLTLAERLAQPPWSNEMSSNLPFTVRFIAFGSEETGRDGSKHYVDQLTSEEVDAIGIVINLAVVGSGSDLYLRGPRNSWAVDHISNAAKREGMSYKSTTESFHMARGSDELYFEYRGISTLRFFGDDTTRVDTHKDTIEFINPVLLGDTTVLILDLLDYLRICKDQPNFCASL